MTLKQFKDKPVQLDCNNEFRAIQNSSRIVKASYQANNGLNLQTEEDDIEALRS